jgi:putative membrane protein
MPDMMDRPARPAAAGHLMRVSLVAGKVASMRSMLGRLLVRWVLLAVVLAVTAWIVPAVDINGGVWGTLVAAAVFGLVNAIIGPILRLLSLPLTLITFGLFALVVNAVLLGLAAWLTDDLDVGGPISTIVAALLISVLTWVVHLLTGGLRRD